MSVSDKMTKLSLGEASNFAHKSLTALTGGRSAYALAGLTLFSLASLAFLESSLVLKLYMIGVTLVVVSSMITISLRDRDAASYLKIEETLPVSNQPSANLCFSDVEQQKPHLEMPDSADDLKLAENPNVQPKIAQLTGDDMSKSTKTPIQVCAFAADDSVQCELSAATATVATVTQTVEVEQTPEEHISLNLKPANAAPLPKIVSVGNDTAIACEGDAQTKGATAKVSPSLLPENILKGTATEAFGIADAPVTTTAASKKTAKKKFAKRAVFSGEGVIHFLHRTKMWGRIRLSTPTKWGENQVFFHRKHFAGNAAVQLHRGQRVRVEYIYRRQNNSKKDRLRACRVEFTTPSGSRHTKWSPRAAAPKQNWRSKSMLQRPSSPTTRSKLMLQRPSSPPRAHAMRVAKGPSADGGRGFHFMRTVK